MSRRGSPRVPGLAVRRKQGALLRRYCPQVWWASHLLLRWGVEHTPAPRLNVR